MDRIDSFWAGAQDHGRGLDLARLAEDFGSWSALLGASPRHLADAARIDLIAATAWLRTSPRQTRGTALTLVDPRYPALLRELPSAPPVLCVEGDLGAFDLGAIAVVGTRRCTPYGIAMARRLAGGLAAGGLAVVSGLARGIDGHAHRAALETGRTVAVLAHGLDHTAPASHIRLRDRIVQTGGCVVSTWPDHVEPRPFLFPRRNRWIAGLSEGTVVVEAGSRSGAKHTAFAAADQGRDVWIVPGPIGAPASMGCLELARVGASVIVDVDEFVLERTAQQPLRRDPWVQTLLAGQPLEEVARFAGMSLQELLVTLSQMELRGEVVRLPGQRYAAGGSPG